MAAVTLKDLMDPLTKIQAATESTAASMEELTMAVATTGQANKIATESTSKAIEALTGAVVASGQVGDGIQGAILAELQLQTRMMENRKGGGLMSLFGGGGGGGAKGLQESGDGFRALGGGTSAMAKALLLFMLVPKGTIKKFNLFFIKRCKRIFYAFHNLTIYFKSIYPKIFRCNLTS